VPDLSKCARTESLIRFMLAGGIGDNLRIRRAFASAARGWTSGPGRL